MKEGWTYLYNSTKWHYFRGGRSLCARYFLLMDPREGYEQGNNASKDNCKGCVRKLEKENAKSEKRSV